MGFKNIYKLAVILCAILLASNFHNSFEQQSVPIFLQRKYASIEADEGSFYPPSTMGKSVGHEGSFGETEEIPDEPKENLGETEENPLEPESGSEETEEIPDEPEASLGEPEENPDEPEGNWEGGGEISKDPQNIPEIHEGLQSILEEIALIEGRALLPNEVVVTTFAQLKDALSNDNGIDTVYLGQNITLASGGIKIHTSKTSIVIDGINPSTPGQLQPYTLMDFYNASQPQSHTIYANGTNTALTSIHVRNLTIVGKNPFGPISIYDITGTQGIVVTYESIKYTGPCLGYNMRGTCRFIDIDARITGINGGGPITAFSMSKNVYIEEYNMIVVESGAYFVFGLPGGGIFELTDNAGLEINSHMVATGSPVFSAFGSGQLDISIGNNSVLGLHVDGKVTNPSTGSINDVVLKENSYFSLDCQKILTSDLINIIGDITVGNNAYLVIEGVGVQSGVLAGLVRLGNGKFTLEEGSNVQIVGNGYYRQLIESTGGTFIVKNTAKSFFYNRDNRLFTSATNDAKWDIQARQINYWNSANPGGFNNKPSQSWRKEDGSMFEIKADLAFGYGGLFKNMTSNFAAGVDPGTAPTPTTLNIQSSRIISFGGIYLQVNPLDQTSKNIIGRTESRAMVSSWFVRDGTTYTFPTVQASDDGSFSIPSGRYHSLEDVDYVYVMSTNGYFTTTEKVPVEKFAKGELKLTIPPTLGFVTTNLSHANKRIQRSDPNWEIEIEDGRGIGSSWTLKAKIMTPLNSLNPSIPDLDSDLLFIDENNTVKTLSTDAYTKIDTHTSASNSETIKIKWNADKGILAYILQGKAFANESYKGSIEWLLEDAP